MAAKQEQGDTLGVIDLGELFVLEMLESQDPLDYCFLISYDEDVQTLFGLVVGGGVWMPQEQTGQQGHLQEGEGFGFGELEPEFVDALDYLLVIVVELQVVATVARGVLDGEVGQRVEEPEVGMRLGEIILNAH